MGSRFYRIQAVILPDARCAVPWPISRNTMSIKAMRLVTGIAQFTARSQVGMD